MTTPAPSGFTHWKCTTVFKESYTNQEAYAMAQAAWAAATQRAAQVAREFFRVQYIGTPGQPVGDAQGIQQLIAHAIEDAAG